MVRLPPSRLLVLGGRREARARRAGGGVSTEASESEGNREGSEEWIADALIAAVSGLELVMCVVVDVDVEDPRAITALVHSVRCSIKAFQPREKEFHEGGYIFTSSLLISFLFLSSASW